VCNEILVLLLYPQKNKCRRTMNRSLCGYLGLSLNFDHSVDVGSRGDAEKKAPNDSQEERSDGTFTEEPLGAPWPIFFRLLGPGPPLDHWIR
jgi:hypothetical protein